MTAQKPARSPITDHAFDDSMFQDGVCQVVTEDSIEDGEERVWRCGKPVEDHATAEPSEDIA